VQLILIAHPAAKRGNVAQKATPTGSFSLMDLAGLTSVEWRPMQHPVEIGELYDIARFPTDRRPETGAA
jgi:hypothetical protein